MQIFLFQNKSIVISYYYLTIKKRKCNHVISVFIEEQKSEIIPTASKKERKNREKLNFNSTHF